MHPAIRETITMPKTELGPLPPTKNVKKYITAHVRHTAK